MMKTTKYQPGTYLELDNGAGGRKVVLVGRDGVTYWDSIDPSKVTPLVIHPVLKPVELGSVSSFISAKNLRFAAPKAMEVLSVFKPTRQQDSIYIMRVLWHLASKATGEQWVPQEGEIRDALAEAERQEGAVFSLHEAVARYNAIPSRVC